MKDLSDINAEVIAVFPDKVKIAVEKLEDFRIAEEELKVGSYLSIEDNENSVMIASIETFSIEVGTDKEGKATRKYMIEANPLGVISNGVFQRGGDAIAIPPKGVKPAPKEYIQKIFEESLEKNKQFVFSSLASNEGIRVPVDGNKFFGKHIAIVGSTGSGKSHSVAKILQNAIDSKSTNYEGLNNTHIIIFDIHSEYRSAFPKANYLDISNLVLPYWMLSGDELQELFLDTEANDHNQRNVFKEAVVNSKKSHFEGEEAKKERIHFDSAIFFEINEVLQAAKSKNEEMVPGTRDMKAGPLNGKLTNFVSRLENKINDPRLTFLIGEKAKKITFEETLKQLMGYGEDKANVTILDLSGIPFDVLSITVSLISRILFQYGYYYKRLRCEKDPSEKINNDIPLLLVYEEAHKYVPNSDLLKYRASKDSIERIAKEGRKYGISLMLASQRPSEISETIFSQCNNFLALRLTNPNDQNYVKRLLPDTMGKIVDRMPSLRSGECILIGDAVVLPSIVKIDQCENAPSSNDIPYMDVWKDKWKELDMEELKNIWLR